MRSVPSCLTHFASVVLKFPSLFLTFHQSASVLGLSIVWRYDLMVESRNTKEEALPSQGGGLLCHSGEAAVLYEVQIGLHCLLHRLILIIIIILTVKCASSLPLR